VITKVKNKVGQGEFKYKVAKFNTDRLNKF